VTSTSTTTHTISTTWTFTWQDAELVSSIPSDLLRQLRYARRLESTSMITVQPTTTSTLVRTNVIKGRSTVRGVTSSTLLLQKILSKTLTQTRTVLVTATRTETDMSSITNTVYY
jgi:hypothetical protein